MGAQVITGVGFLGAGTIMREGSSITGLTTAASLWATACLGLAAGAGYYAVAFAGMIFIFVTLTLFELIQQKFVSNHTISKLYRLEVTDVGAVIADMNAHLDPLQASLHNIRSQRRSELKYSLFFRVDFIGKDHQKHAQDFFNALIQMELVEEIQTEDDPIIHAR